MPRQAPAERSRCADSSGTKASSAPSKRSRPRDCEKEMHARRPAARHGEEVAVEPLAAAAHAPVPLDAADLGGADAEPAVGAADVSVLGHTAMPAFATRTTSSTWRWVVGAFGVGTYRRNDSVDVGYEVDGRPMLAEGLDIESLP